LVRHKTQKTLQLSEEAPSLQGDYKVQVKNNTFFSPIWHTSVRKDEGSELMCIR